MTQNNTPQILHSFKIKVIPEDNLFMFAKLSNAKYTKTYMVNGEVKSIYIDHLEYASALATYLLKKPTTDTH